MQAQIKINSEQEINRLRTDNEYYIGKPFKVLLNDIHLKIKAYKGARGYDIPNVIIIYFEDKNNIQIKKANNINPTIITVFFGNKDKNVNSYFDYLDQKKVLKYNDQSFEPFKNLIVLGIEPYTEKKQNSL